LKSQVGFPKNFVGNFVANFVEGWPPLAYWDSTKFATKFATKEFCKTGVQLAKAFPTQEVVLLSSDPSRDAPAWVENGPNKDFLVPLHSQSGDNPARKTHL
jgi:hypothetical protein